MADRTDITDLPVAERSWRVMRSAPLLPIAVGLILGIVFDERFDLGAAAYAVVFLASSALALVKRHRPVWALAWVVVGSGCVGGMLHIRTARTHSASNVAHIADVHSRIVRLRGMVVNEPRTTSTPDYAFTRWSYRSERTVFLFDAKAVEATSGFIPIDGRIRVTVNEAILDLHQGERVEVFGRLYRFRSPQNPGSFDWGSFHRRHNIDAGLSCDQRENVVRLDPADARGRRSVISRLGVRARGLLVDDLAPGDEGEASLLQAMILGQRSRVDRKLNDIFIRAGCVHFLAVSGVHVLIVMLFTRTFFRLLGVGRVTSILGMMGVVVLYALIAEPRPPILRATIMAVAYCLSRLLGRSSAPANWIALAAIILIAVNPLTIYDVGFQLSFTAVMGVARLTPVLNSWGPILRRLVTNVDRTDAELLDSARATRQEGKTFGVQPLFFWILGHKWFRAVATLLAVSVAAWVVTMPIVVTHFGRFHPWGPLNSVLVFPLVMLVMALGFAKLLAGVVSPGLGMLFAWPLSMVDSFLIWVVDGLAVMPGANVLCSGPPWWAVFSYYAVLLSLVKPGRERDPFEDDEFSTAVSRETLASITRHVPFGVACAALVVCCTVWWGGPAATNELRVTVLAVGGGSVTVIELPDGQTVLYDAGSSRPYDVGRSVVVPFLRHRGVTRIERIFISHPNLDHYSGVPGIVAEIKTGPVVINPLFRELSPGRSPSRHLLELLEARGHPIETLDPRRTEWEIGGAKFEWLWPRSDSAETLSPNNSSTVLRVSYLGQSILLTGDVEDVAQQALLNRGDLRADVLLLPHHGSVRPSSKAFFEAVGASSAIRSSWQRMSDNRSGLQAVLGATRIYNTADIGAVQVVMDGQAIRVTPALGP